MGWEIGDAVQTPTGHRGRVRSIDPDGRVRVTLGEGGGESVQVFSPETLEPVAAAEVRGRDEARPDEPQSPGDSGSGGGGGDAGSGDAGSGDAGSA